MLRSPKPCVVTGAAARFWFFLACWVILGHGLFVFQCCTLSYKGSKSQTLPHPSKQPPCVGIYCGSALLLCLLFMKPPRSKRHRNPFTLEDGSEDKLSAWMDQQRCKFLEQQSNSKWTDEDADDSKKKMFVSVCKQICMYVYWSQKQKDFVCQWCNLLC